MDELSGLAPEPDTAHLPNPAEAAALLARLKVASVDVAEAVAALPDPDVHPKLWWLLERCRHRLITDMGGTEFPTPWPQLPSTLGPVGRYFYLAVVLATLPATRRFHTTHGIPDEIAWASLADLGEKVGLHRRFFGVGGFDRQDWFTLHFRGVLYALGRLQFNLTAIPANFDGLTPETPALGLHLPETGGPITPQACLASLSLARQFFSRHFGIDCGIATCTSWLLDPQLADYLPDDSNIIQFQRRFRLLPETRNGNADILGFVFRRINPGLDTLPQNTTLQRAVVAHLRSGRHWHVRSGWIEL
ncbi:acyltransferase domain-containing protein [Saccharopolyspora rosea]|uniref:Acyltransferase domain-containing protein n=1 Tax=Saccharopolyspora rosea TaxID=524884 RepID=A0ABW3FV72_9PSEU|nr:acyltransferase domain-containing protein [Saccharopolyspora rosea]